jgi:predicted metal-binding protein
MIERVRALALEYGFSHVGTLEVGTIRIRPEVRDACAADKCKAYNKTWSCPPGCGTLAECETKIRKYKTGILLQTTGILEDPLDYETMEQTGRQHGKNLDGFAKEIKQLCPSCMVIGAGASTRCESCTYPGSPCRFPGDMTSSMEALGMIVSDVCRDNNLPYYYGPNTLTYTGCILFG